MKETIFINLEIEELKQIISEVMREVVREELDRFDFRDKYPDLLSTKDTAKILGISLQTLNEWTKEGRIPKYKINKRVFFKKDEVYEALQLIKVYKF